MTEEEKILGSFAEKLKEHGIGFDTEYDLSDRIAVYIEVGEAELSIGRTPTGELKIYGYKALTEYFDEEELDNFVTRIKEVEEYNRRDDSSKSFAEILIEFGKKFIDSEDERFYIAKLDELTVELLVNDDNSVGLCSEIGTKNLKKIVELYDLVKEYNKNNK